MARLPHIVRRRKKSKIMGKPDTISHRDIAAMQVDARLELIRALIPIGLAHVAACVLPDRTGVAAQNLIDT